MKKQKNKNWKVIKIKLEKAYNRVRSKFIDASLHAAGIPNIIHHVIMSAITSSSIQVLWNGVPTQKFRPARGI